jgi:hypothetical protein
MFPVAVPVTSALRSTPAKELVPDKMSCQFEELIDAVKLTKRSEGGGSLRSEFNFTLVPLPTNPVA